jgi:hypothetical protein
LNKKLARALFFLGIAVSPYLNEKDSRPVQNLCDNVTKLFHNFDDTIEYLETGRASDSPVNHSEGCGGGQFCPVGGSAQPLQVIPKTVDIIMLVLGRVQHHGIFKCNRIYGSVVWRN